MTPSSEVKIKEVAYELWEQEGRPVGRDQDHYYKAEQLVSGERESTSAKPKAATRVRKATAKAPATPKTGRKTTAKKNTASS